MSNRIRVLFYNALEGSNVAHVGNQALRAMRLIRAQEKTLSRETVEEWVNNREWKLRGSPTFVRRSFRMSAVTGRGETQYLIGVPSKAPPMADEPWHFKNGLERLQWLWENLPAGPRGFCQLKVFRENRWGRWHQSLANPSRWGWAAPVKASAAQTDPIALVKPFYTQQSSAGIPSSGGWEAAMYSTQGPVVGTPSVLSPEGLNTYEDLASQVLAKQLQAQMAAKKEFIKGLYIQAPGALPKSPKKPFKAHAKLQPSDDEDQILTEPDAKPSSRFKSDSPNEAHPEKTKPEKEKIRLRLGIWS